jgi:ribose 5-phosphate isomerase B
VRIALGSDERSHLTDFVEADLRLRGFSVDLFGAAGEGSPAGESAPWPDVAQAVAERVAGGEADYGVLFCWTGTGVSIAANKVPGVRAALCQDSETARGARAWNQANVLCLSLRTTPEVVAREILDAWFSASPDPSEGPNVEKVRRLEERYRLQSNPERGKGEGIVRRAEEKARQKAGARSAAAARRAP